MPPAVSDRRVGALSLRLVLSLPPIAVTWLVAVAPPASLHAQATTGVVSGRVQNAATGNYLNNARVRVVGTTLETFTNTLGEYRLSGLSAGQVTLEIFYMGLAPQSVAVTVPASGEVQQDVALRVVDAPEGTPVILNQFLVQSQRETDATAIAINEQRFAATNSPTTRAAASGRTATRCT